MARDQLQTGYRLSLMASSGCLTAEARRRGVICGNNLAVIRKKSGIDLPRNRCATWCLVWGAILHESFRFPADPHDRFCCCCLLTNRCLCLPLASRTSGGDWSGQTTIFLDVATQASIEANGLEAILRYIWTNVGIRSGLFQQIRRSRQEGHAHLRTEWP
jgi:hypothetical protein